MKMESVIAVLKMQKHSSNVVTIHSIISVISFFIFIFDHKQNDTIKAGLLKAFVMVFIQFKLFQ